MKVDRLVSIIMLLLEKREWVRRSWPNCSKFRPARYTVT